MKNYVKILSLLLVLSFLIQPVMAETKMYWSDSASGKIQRANLDGSFVEDILTGVSHPHGIAFDMLNEKMYYATAADSFPINGKIWRANLDGSNPETLINGLHVPRGIDLDLIHGKIYWGQSGGGTKKLQRADLDGSNMETLITGVSPNDIALHLRSGKIYWVNGDDVLRANLDGSDIEIIVDNLDWPLGLTLDSLNGKIYWTDSGTGRIQRANLDGTEIKDIVASGLANPWYIALTLKSDTDKDGIKDSEDVCSGTTQETAALTRLATGRYADIDNDGTFETRKPIEGVTDSELSLADTSGCTCNQILEKLPSQDASEILFGCKLGTIKRWIENMI